MPRASSLSRRHTCCSRTLSGGATGTRDTLPVRFGRASLHRDEAHGREAPAVAGPGRMQRRQPGAHVPQAPGALPREGVRLGGRARRATVRARKMAPPADGPRREERPRPAERPRPLGAPRHAATPPRPTRIHTVRMPRGANPVAMPRAGPIRGPRNTFHGGRTSRRVVRPRAPRRPEPGRARTTEPRLPPRARKPRQRRRSGLRTEAADRHAQRRQIARAPHSPGAPRTPVQAARRTTPIRPQTTLRPAARALPAMPGPPGRTWMSTADRVELPGRWPPAATFERATQTCRVAARSSIEARRLSPGPKRARSQRTTRAAVRQPTTC
jgi:hypothetical protein